MKRRIITLVASIIIGLCLIAGCGGSANKSTDDTDKTTTDSTSETHTEEPKTIDTEAVIADISSAISYMDICASTQHDWLGVSNNLPYLYSDTDYEGGNNDDARAAGKSCYESRKSANEYLNKAKEAIKDSGNSDSISSIQDYYLAATEYLSFISNFPEGYNKITWGQKWNELRQSCDTAKSKAELN